MTTLACPTCSKPVKWTEQFPFKPFCSERCKLIDLGAWANESHRIPGDRAIPDQESSNETAPGLHD